jgi:hypothetical protein
MNSSEDSDSDDCVCFYEHIDKYCGTDKGDFHVLYGLVGTDNIIEDDLVGRISFDTMDKANWFAKYMNIVEEIDRREFLFTHTYDSGRQMLYVSSPDPYCYKVKCESGSELFLTREDADFYSGLTSGGQCGNESSIKKIKLNEDTLAEYCTNLVVAADSRGISKMIEMADEFMNDQAKYEKYLQDNITSEEEE